MTSEFIVPLLPARLRGHSPLVEIDDEELILMYLPLSVWPTASCLPSVLPPLFIELRLEPGDDPQPP